MTSFNPSTIQNHSQNFNQLQLQRIQTNPNSMNSNTFLLSDNQSSNQGFQDTQLSQHKSGNAEIISKSIVYGSLALWLGKKSEQNLTHKWCVYVRGINNEDISYFVKEVVFTLHATFENNVRTISKWPYELYASGWGEFDIKITIHLLDESIKPIEFIHFLKLYPPANQTPSTKKPIVSEFFDEIVFVNPKKHLRECLLAGSSISCNIKRDTNTQIPLNFNKYDDDKRSENSHQDEENKNKIVNNQNSNTIENKMENLNICNGNYNINDSQNNDMNFNTQQIFDDVEMDEHFDQSQYLNQHSGNLNANFDSISVFSNNVNVNFFFILNIYIFRKILKRKVKIRLKTIPIIFLIYINILQLLMILLT